MTDTIKLIIEAVKKGNGLEKTAREAAELENAVRDLRRELTKSKNAFETSKSASISLRSEYKKLLKSGQGSEQAFAALSREIEKAGATELKAIRSTQELIGEIRTLGDKSGITSSELGQLSDRLQESEGKVTGVGGAVKRASDDMRVLSTATDKVGDEIGQLTTETKGTNKALGKIDDNTREATGAFKRMGSGINDARQALDKIEKKSGVVTRAMGNILSDTIQNAAQAFVEFAKVSYESFRKFDDEARRVFAQTPNLSATMRKNLVGDAKVIAASIGRLPQETLPALRKALNLGISEENLFSSIETASLAARVGGESLIDTMVLGQSVVNAYGGELYSLQDSYDQLNYITQNSNLEFSDLNANMNEIISAAAEAGIGLDSVAGAMVTMNRQGDDATEIGQLLSNVLTQISIEGTALGSAFEQAAGVGFRKFTASGGTLSEGLQILQQHAKDTGQDLLNMVGGSSPFFRDVQAARGILELTGKHAADLAQNIEGAAEAQGSLTEAAREFEDGPALAYDRAAASVENLKLATGEWLVAIADGIGLIDNANTAAQALSGTLTHQVTKLTDEIVESARQTGNYEAAFAKLTKTFEENPLDFGLGKPITAATETLVRDLAKSANSYEDFHERVREINASVYDTTAILPQFSFDMKEIYNEENTAQINKTRTAVLSFNDAMQAQTSTLSLAAVTAQESQKAAYAFHDELYGGVDATRAYIGMTEDARDAAFAFNDKLLWQDAQLQNTSTLLERTASESERFALAQARAATEAEELAVQQQAVTDSTIGYFDRIVTGQAETLSYNEIAYQTGIQYADTATAAIGLAIATGEMTKEQALAEYSMAASQAAASELGRQYAEGAISLSELQDGLANLVEYSPYEAESNVDTGDAGQRLGAIIAQLDGLDGRRTKSTHINEIINRTKNEGGSGGKGDDKGGSDAGSGVDDFPDHGNPYRPPPADNPPPTGSQPPEGAFSVAAPSPSVTIINYNNTREAAALAMAQAEQMRRQRMDRI